MWDWGHFREEGWISHTKRAMWLALLLLCAGGAMVIHAVIPFWQQPRVLCVEAVCTALRGALAQTWKGPIKTVNPDSEYRT
jgi:hypothetical protein